MLKGARYLSSNGYMVVRCPEHPLAKRRGAKEEREHRVVYYDTHGAGPFACHWCGALVTWDTLHIDHVDSVKSNNDPANLVASCAHCNLARGRSKMRETMRERYARTLTFDGITKTLSEWAVDVGVTTNTLKHRLKSGWDPERAVTTPRGATGPRVGAMERASATPRAAMTNARRRAVWEAGDKRCAGCDRPIPMRGGTVVDHILPLELGGLDEPSNLQMLCVDCDRGKTHWDAKRIAKMRRQAKMHEPKPSRLQSAGKIQSAGFRKDISKKFSGAVVPRKEPA